MITTTAPAKIILFGEHAVVYGEPAIAVPLAQIRAKATIRSSDAPLMIVARDLNNKVIQFDGEDPLAKAARLTLNTLGIESVNATMQIESQIPIAGGLGSGAAISTVIVRALCAFTGQTLTTDAINHLVYEVEKLHHGTPSGIDNTVIVYEEAIYYRREQPIDVIQNGTLFTLLVANTGIAASTKIAVDAVRQQYETELDATKPVITAIGHIAERAKAALQAGHLQKLGQLMNQNHEHLRTLTVSSDELDRLVSVAQESGALGAKLSGGGRGGNMIALVTDDVKARVHDALLRAGATSVLETVVEQTVS